MGRFVQRNRWRRGRWLVIDDESGFVEYSDKVVRRWDGMYVRKDQNEPPDPQWYISAPADPPPVPFVRPDEPDGPSCRTRSPFYPAGNILQEGFDVQDYGFELEDGSGVLLTEYPQVPVPRFAGYDLYVGVGIGLMEIECSFTVFPDGA